MTASMKAALMVATGRDLEVRDVPVPTPGPGELLVRLDACGICHTDLHAWQGDQPLPRDPDDHRTGDHERDEAPFAADAVILSGGFRHSCLACGFSTRRPS